MHPTLLLAGLFAALALSACGAVSPPAEPEPLAAAELGTTRNVHFFDGIYLAGQPSEADLALARDRGVRTVFNVRREQEQSDFDEAAAVEALGMTYVHLPWSGPDQLTDEIFDAGRGTLAEAERPMLFH